MDPKKLTNQEDIKKEKPKNHYLPPVKKPIRMPDMPEKKEDLTKRETPDKSPKPPKYRLHNGSQPSKSKSLWDTITEKGKK